MPFDDKCWEQPWHNDKLFEDAHARSAGAAIAPQSRCWTLWTAAKIARQYEGEFWECGVFRGGTAALIVDAFRDESPCPVFRLFDTFTGIPFKDDVDKDIVGQFANTDTEMVRRLVNYRKAVIHKGLIPDTFVGLEGSKIAFCHVDVDVYRSIRACCEFVWPRLVTGGVMVFDDYNVRSCPGARLATDEFFADKRAYLVQTFAGGAIVVKPPQYEPPKEPVQEPHRKEWNIGRLKLTWTRK